MTTRRTKNHQRYLNLNHLSIGDPAPDFTLPNHEGTLFKLSDLFASRSVLLVFNLGFA